MVWWMVVVVIPPVETMVVTKSPIDGLIGGGTKKGTTWYLYVTNRQLPVVPGMMLDPLAVDINVFCLMNTPNSKYKSCTFVIRKYC
jgi:hypothetical protein